MSKQHVRTRFASGAVGASIVLCLLLMAGCGQKGDLYFPKDKTSASQPVQQN